MYRSSVFKGTKRARIAARNRQQARFRATYRRGGFLGQELKFYDTKLISGVLSATSNASAGEHDPSATIVLNSTTQGDGEQQRDGRKMTMKSIYITGKVDSAVQSSLSAGRDSCAVFIALVLDTQTNGVTIVSEQVFKNVGANAILAAQLMRNLDFVTRYKVLATKKLVLQNPNVFNDTGSTGGSSTNGIERQFTFYKNLDNLGVTFNGTTESVANITDNSLHLIAYTNSTVLAPLISYFSRLRFMG